jgi:hypothetical protein
MTHSFRLVFDCQPLKQSVRDARHAASESHAEVFFSSIGAALDSFFGQLTDSAASSSTKSVSASSSSSLPSLAPSQSRLYHFQTRAVPVPTGAASNRHDMLVNMNHAAVASAAAAASAAVAASAATASASASALVAAASASASASAAASAIANCDDEKVDTSIEETAAAAASSKSASAAATATAAPSTASMLPIYCAIVPSALDSESDGMLAAVLSGTMERYGVMNESSQCHSLQDHQSYSLPTQVPSFHCFMCQ